MQRITDPICKESPCNALVSGKINFSPEAVSDSKSKASEFFTGDGLGFAINTTLADLVGRSRRGVSHSAGIAWVEALRRGRGWLA
jgi:hypothetical protein